MVLALIPVSAFAQQTAPTGSAANFFANGTPVEITKDVPENAQEDTLDGLRQRERMPTFLGRKAKLKSISGFPAKFRFMAELMEVNTP